MKTNDPQLFKKLKQGYAKFLENYQNYKKRLLGLGQIKAEIIKNPKDQKIQWIKEKPQLNQILKENVSSTDSNPILLT